MKKVLQKIVPVFAVVLASMQLGCQKNIPIPYYIHIDSVSVANVDYSQHGTTNSKITDVWVYADNKLMGAYNLPANIPVISTSKIVDIRAGIAENGINNRRMAYPFYFLSVYNIDWAQGTYKTINPIVNYRTNTKMLINEDFEVGTNFEIQNASAPITYVTDTTRLEGSASGGFYLDTGKKAVDIIINNELALAPGQTAFLELNYKSDIDFEVNLKAINSGSNLTEPFGIRAKNKWNKIYLNLQNVVNAVKANKYKLNIRTLLPNDKTNGYLLIDNVKLVVLQ
jgi:hypothetical protein